MKTILTILVLMLFIQTNAQQWTTKAPMPTARHAMGAAVINDIIYVVGGSNNNSNLTTLEAYNTTTNSWSNKASMTVPRGELGVAAVNGKIYAIGGYGTNAVNAVEEYNPATDTWTTKAPMPTARSIICVTVINNKIYVVGGWPGNISTLELYDPATDTWATKAPCSIGRHQINCAVSLNNEMYYIGGKNNLNSNFYAINESYNPATNSWTTHTALPQASFDGAAVVINNEIHLFGGTISYNIADFNTHFIYNSSTDAWTNGLPMINKRAGHVAVNVNNDIYVIGGFDSTSNIVNRTEKYSVGLTSVNNLVTDVDGNSYPNVTIGNQEWMGSDLKTTKYANGDAIIHADNSWGTNGWATLNAGGWCWFNNDSATYDYSYGKLYNAFAVNDSRNVCPTGWHVPDTADWNILENYLGGKLVAGGKLKATGTQFWFSPNTGADNSSGFSAVGAEYRDQTGGWGPNTNAKVNNLLWTSTIVQGLNAARRIGYGNADVSHETHVPNHGFTIRCLKNTYTSCVATTSINNLAIPSANFPYTWNGLTFTSAGSQTAHLTNAAGCDSAATLNLSIQLPNYLPSNGLVGYWPFNGNANDESGNGNNGTVNGATLTTDRFGNANSAYSFDGISNYISTSNINLHDTGSISVWVNPFLDAAGNNSWGYSASLIDENQDAIGNSGYNLLYNNTAGHGLYAGVGYSGNSNTTIMSHINLSLNNWHHCVLTLNNGTGKLYMDGVLIKTQTGLSSTSQTSNVLLFGKAPWASNGNLFNGKLDDIRIYNRTLNQQEITALYKNHIDINLKMYFETYYTNGNLISSLNGADGISEINKCDTVQIMLHDSATNSIIWSGKAVVDTSGNCQIKIPDNLANTRKSIGVNHRGSIETWSAQPVLLSNGINYDFTTASNKALGDNLVSIGNGKYGIYCGDINQDGSVDFNDYPDLDISSSNGDIGYFACDLNGDASVDFNDYPIIDLNSGLGILSFAPIYTPLASKPSLATKSVLSVSQTTATCGGNILSIGYNNIKARGICWSTNTNPSIQLTTKTQDGAGIGTFTSVLNGLAPATTYYVRAYAIGAADTAYGEEISFTTQSLQLGQTYAGGIIFYIDGTGKHGLVCAANDVGQFTWGCGGTSIGSTSVNMGTGAANTTAIINACNLATSAAKTCDNLIEAALNDWYLPSKSELALMRQNLHLNGWGSFANASYWTSSEYSSGNAWLQSFATGTATNASKSNSYKVRAIRSF